MWKCPWGAPLTEAALLYQELNLGATQQALCSSQFAAGSELLKMPSPTATSFHLFPLQNHQWNMKQLRSNLAHQRFTSGYAVTNCPVQLWTTSTKFMWNLACSFCAAALCFLWILNSPCFLQIICLNDDVCNEKYSLKHMCKDIIKIVILNQNKCPFSIMFSSMS